MKLLYHPQLSMRSYGDRNEWLFFSDAQVTKMRAYVDALPSEWEWLWMVPEGVKLPRGFTSDWARTMPGNVQKVHCSWMDNVLEGRFYFPMKDAYDIVYAHDIDILLCEVPEHARAWRVVQKRAGVQFPIISMVEHVDFYEQTRGIYPEDIAFSLRQLDGALTSDMLAFPLFGMQTGWFANLHRIGISSEDIHVAVQEKSRVWNAIYSPKEIEDCGYGAWGVENPGFPVINFISRLSDNDRTRYEEFFRACRELWHAGVRFEVWVQNPNDAKSEEWIRAQGEFVTKVGNTGRQDYMASLWGSHIVPILYPMDKIYSLGCCEAITARNIVVSQDGYERGSAIGFESQTSDDIKDGLARALVTLGENQLVIDAVLDRQRDALMASRSVEENIAVVEASIALLTEDA